MANMPKPELERGSFIAYADEPNTVVSGSGGGGGGGIVVIEGIATDSSLEMQASYNNLYEHFDNGKVCFLHFANGQHSMYGMMHISAISHSESYKAYVIWPFSGGTPTAAEFDAASATENLVFTMGG